MFKLFNKKQSIQSVIEKIHGEFDSASERLLLEAKEILEAKSSDKGDRLKSLGFTSAKAVKDTEEQRKTASDAKWLAEKVAYFSQWYPHNKFITEKEVERICKKYGLVFGDASRYKGDVPEKNLKEMESFKLRNEDMTSRSEYSDYYENALRARIWGHSSRLDNFPSSFGIGSNISDSDFNRMRSNISYSKPAFKICAPEKDFDMTHMEKRGYKLEYDPIVLQPVNGGYLIVTKWGLEASDEIVTNPVSN